MLNTKVTYPAAIIAMAAFLFLVKLMYDMSIHMARMTDQVAAMNVHMEKMGADVQGMRMSIDRMSFAFQKGSQQMQQLNPMEMMQGVVPGNRPR